MNNKRLSLSLILTATLLQWMALHPVHAAGPTLAPTLATEQMAGIILGMNSKPGKEDLITLDDIAKDNSSTGNERTLATIIMNMESKIRPDDKPVVMKIWLSPSASETERSLAKALLKFEQQPNDQVKAALNLFTQGKANN